MSYRLKFHPDFIRHIETHKKAGNKSLVRKTESLITELREHPRTGTGKPEQLRYYSGEIWSRRIDRQHRLIYEITEEGPVVTALSAYGHYDEK